MRVSMMLPPKVKRSTMAAQSRGSVKVFVQPPNDSFEAIATLFHSSRSVRTWKRGSAPRRSSSMPLWAGRACPDVHAVVRRRPRWGKKRRLTGPSTRGDDLCLLAYQVMDAAGLQRGRLTGLALRREDLVDVGHRYG